MKPHFAILPLLTFLSFLLSGCGGGNGPVSTSNSNSQPSQSASALTISPTSTTLGIGSSMQFTAGAASSTLPPVTWSVQEGATGGSVNSTGLYTAPQTPGTYHLKVTSQTSVSNSATATILVQTGSGNINLQ